MRKARTPGRSYTVCRNFASRHVQKSTAMSEVARDVIGIHTKDLRCLGRLKRTI